MNERVKFSRHWRLVAEIIIIIRIIKSDSWHALPLRR
jgi:hypothetical protein